MFFAYQFFSATGEKMIIFREKGGEVSYGSRSPWRVILRDEEAQRNRMSDRDMRVTRREMMKVYMYIVQLNISNFQKLICGYRHVCIVLYMYK